MWPVFILVLHWLGVCSLASGIFALVLHFCMHCGSQCNSPPLLFLTLFPILCCLMVSSVFYCVLFLHRYDVFHYYSLSFILLYSSLVPSTSPTFRHMVCIYFYAYIILLVFLLGMYSTCERKHSPFAFLNLADLLKMMFSSSIHLLANDKFHSSLWLKKIPLYINTTFS
jgi:hypothetical protein